MQSNVIELRITEFPEEELLDTYEWNMGETVPEALTNRMQDHHKGWGLTYCGRYDAPCALRLRDLHRTPSLPLVNALVKDCPVYIHVSASGKLATNESACGQLP